MLLQRGPKVFLPHLPLVQETPDLFLTVWLQITEATTVGKNIYSVWMMKCFRENVLPNRNVLRT